MYSVFVRDWWVDNPKWPDGLEPSSTCPKEYIAEDLETIEEARAICREYNDEHDPGRYGRKAEFREE